jgi:hypothetical protein
MLRFALLNHPSAALFLALGLDREMDSPREMNSPMGHARPMRAAGVDMRAAGVDATNSLFL